MRDVAKAVREENVPAESCERYRHYLEYCTYRQTSLLLQTALLPPNSEFDSLML